MLDERWANVGRRFDGSATPRHEYDPIANANRRALRSAYPRSLSLLYGRDSGLFGARDDDFRFRWAIIRNLGGVLKKRRGSAARSATFCRQ
jgi:hypothetical protein